MTDINKQTDDAGNTWARVDDQTLIVKTGNLPELGMSGPFVKMRGAWLRLLGKVK